jgi:two-component system sensor histidine kinase/response regulator
MSNAKILLVDDLEGNLVALEALLRGDDVELLKAQSARAALELLLVHDVALALVDVQMPEMDGFELAELMRGSARTRHVPIIFVTAGMREQARVFQGYDAGAVDFLFKPIEPGILKHKARVFLDLYRQKQALREALRTNEEILAVVSHDLRSPLGAVLMTAELFADSNQPDVMRAAKHIRSSGLRMKGMLDDLLDLSRARLGGGIPIDPRPVDLADVARRVVAELQAAHPRRTVFVRTKGDTRGEWDGGRLEQVLSNLVGNALRHGTAETAVSVAIDGSAAGTVAVSVHNAGHVPPGLLPRLFEPFLQGRAGKTAADGLGLGLYIVQQIAHAHGGEVTVDSTEATGTTLRVELPRHELPH